MPTYTVEPTDVHLADFYLLMNVCIIKIYLFKYIE